MLLAVAKIVDLHCLANRQGKHQLIQGRQVFGQLGVNLLVVYGGDDVAGLQSGLCGRRTLDDPLDQYAALVLIAS